MLPIFSPLDRPEVRTEFRLGDYNFISKKLTQRETPLSVEPFFGDAWYTKLSTAHLLDAGIVTWGNITHVLHATAHVPAKVVGDVLRGIDLMWDEVSQTFLGQEWLAGRDPRLLKKHASVALLGLLARQTNYRWSLTTTSCEEDVGASGPYTVRDTPGSPLVAGLSLYKDVLTKQEVLSLASTRPIAQYHLEYERLQVARARHLFLSISRRQNVLALRTDELLVQVARRQQAELIQRFEA